MKVVELPLIRELREAVEEMVKDALHPKATKEGWGAKSGPPTSKQLAAFRESQERMKVYGH